MEKKETIFEKAVSWIRYNKLLLTLYGYFKSIEPTATGSYSKLDGWLTSENVGKHQNFKRLKQYTLDFA